MKYILLHLALLVALLPAHTVTHYTAQPPQCDGDRALIRTFVLDGQKRQLVINTQTLKTTIEPLSKTPWDTCDTSHYTQLLAHSTTAPYPLHNDGITHQDSRGVVITTDLCPSSKKGFEKQLYETLIAHYPHPVPITLFITGKWIDKHPKALKQFISWERNGALAITWGNHTYTHPYRRGAPARSTFALTPGYDLRRDTLRLEKRLLEAGVAPSVFFRFPGLISDKHTIKIIHDLGLIPIGTDAWIAKGQKPKKGSIVLLHGNRNEPQGVKRFLEIIRKQTIKKIVPLKP
jgi:peptidoglycan/xylan/chitin deacetylase (PgdA/CDA1 family)